MIGRIDTVGNQFGIFSDSQSKYLMGWYSYCKLTCYLVSLSDGKIIWICGAIGEDFYEAPAVEKFNDPPVDYSVTDAIDQIVKGLPPELF